MFPGKEPLGATPITEFPNEVIDEPTVWIPLSDGVRLAARIWRPTRSDEHPVPAILELIPYRRRDGQLADDERIHPFYAGYGFACARVDLRGSGDSDGLLEDEYLPREQDDALEVIDWIAQQSWCDGNVGMTGLSWGGFNSLQVAARAPQALKAVISVGATVDRYNDDVHYKGGCLLNENFGWGSSLTAFMTRPPDPMVVGERWRSMWLERLEGLKFFAEPWLEHQLRDDYWKHGSVCEDYAALRAPVMIAAGWGDLYVNAVPGLLENLSVPTRAIGGPWAHQFPHLATPGPAIDYLGEALRWWQRWLTDVDQEGAVDPKYLAYLKEGSSPDPFAPEVPGVWVSESEWPSPRIEEASFYLTGGGLQQSKGAAPALEIHSPVDTGTTSGEWVPHCFGPEMPHDQRPDDAQSLVFDSAPLRESLDILGNPYVDLTLSSDRSTGNLIVRLCDLGPSGASERVCLGVLNLTQRNGNDQALSMPLDEPVAIRLRLDHVAHRFPIGHRVRVALSTAYWPLIWPAIDNPTLRLAATPARIVLPRRRGPECGSEEAPAQPRIPSSANIRTLRNPRSERCVRRDLGAEATTLEILDDYGELEYADHGMLNSGVKRERYQISWGDPLSATATFHWTLELGRSAWRVRTETQTQLTCDAEHYHLKAQTSAYESGRKVFARKFARAIARLS